MSRRGWLLGLVLVTVTFLVSPAEGRTGAAPRRVEMAPGVFATIAGEDEPWIEAVPLRGEAQLAFARRLTGSADNLPALLVANGGKKLLAGMRWKVPFHLASPDLQQQLLRTLFPGDRLEVTGWNHRVELASLLRGESLWTVADWFTGKGENFRQIREANRMADDALSPGQELWIPARLLRPSLQQALPAGGIGTPADLLQYRRDAAGPYAAYRLQPGEALYSSVVVRFTGRVFAEDVNALAAEIAKRSGIADVTGIPIGYEVKIPLDLLQAEFLPPGDPRRAEYEASLSDSNRFTNPVQANGLAGITVVLDAGHGGADVGASVGSVWESLYVYDIMVRVKSLLETRTAARVLPTVRDGKGFRVPEADVLPVSRGHQVLTTPPYPIEDAKVGVNLRWYLANSQYHKFTDGGESDAKKVVFVSLHADSLHPSLRGAMIYVPSASLTAGRSGRSGIVYTSRAEVRAHPEVEFSLRERQQSEGLSREMATRTIAAFRDRNLPVHPYKPVRERIIRQRAEFVPAVLRYNSIPAKMLVEVCNLANEEDRRLIQTRTFRQQVAEAIVAGILSYYGEDEPPAGGGVQVAKAAAR
ncbi:MAG TPA: N-acetylmuramoyl-L-alanine amidase [Thermoanaerobaculia bacterium]|jgi:N-acetylmuramoyl-L-alanine amidase|nr:N-acetylmuramoyl-L-alanine amidase [Thermoanaerobaculia bacterium]